VASLQFITHVTSAGERWDLIAWNYYGDATLFGPIVMANPKIAIEPVFEAGLVIVIPILQQARVVTADLPPWKRAGA
jgi:phage tail protein X